MVMTKTHWQRYRSGYGLATRLGGNSMETQAVAEANWNIRDPLGLRFDPSCVLNLPLYKKDASSFMSSDSYGHLVTRTGALWRPDGHSFDGDEDFIDLGTRAALTFADTAPWSMVVWVKVTKTPSNDTLSSSSTVATTDSIYLHNTTQVYMRDVNNTYHLVEVGALINLWTQIVVTMDSARVGLVYRDGMLNGQFTVAFLSSAHVFRYIGRTSVFFQGLQGEHEYYNKVLTPAEILRIYQATKWRYR